MSQTKRKVEETVAEEKKIPKAQDAKKKTKLTKEKNVKLAEEEKRQIAKEIRAQKKRQVRLDVKRERVEQDTPAYWDNLKKAYDAAKEFEEKVFPVIKQQIAKVGNGKSKNGFVVPWNDKLVAANDRHCESDDCCDALPLWTLELMECWAKEGQIDSYTQVTYEPITQRVFVMFDRDHVAKLTVGRPGFVDKLRLALNRLHRRAKLCVDDPRDYWEPLFELSDEDGNEGAVSYYKKKKQRDAEDKICSTDESDDEEEEEDEDDDSGEEDEDA